MNNKEKIIQAAKDIFTANGYEGLSMRNLSKQSGVNLSNIYHYFSDKDELLQEVFDMVRNDLGKKRLNLVEQDDAIKMLRQRINFQFENISDVVFILKYYLHFRPKFLKNNSGYIPEKAYLHIQEVVEKGITTGQFNIKKDEVIKESKVITHAINGFLLEYYPDKLSKKELDETVDSIHSFIVRGIVVEKHGGVPM